ncbi:TetR/AcrR family transcriptional regulator [Rossellomorea marisflavi]|uniref:TetR/AcrR family transcriptional regulator n=1 Tax=Rossellomorea marisflavi TaxID=189381 RepID=A0A5D4R9R9_9BACI|nr:TetR/AcrR family transcriptional regulator [Rossellomorea marisflavi]TYS48213.1 TetR/AcrR family transcriptional regulator [Rossellomorea marisflavi]
MNKKEIIIKVAKHLFRTKGYHDTSIQDILDQARVSKGTFYNHFSTKSQLILYIIKKVDQRVEEQQNMLLTDGSLHDKQLFYSQLRVKHSLYGEEKISELYNISLGENDEELQRYIKNTHYKELNWLAQRLINVYGDEIEKNAMDISTHFIGGLGYQFRYSDQKNLNTNSTDILEYNILRLEKNIEITKGTTPLFPYEACYQVDNRKKDLMIKLKGLMNQIQKNITVSEEGKELFSFILEEVQRSDIRWSVCKGAIYQLQILNNSCTHNHIFEDLLNNINEQISLEK